MVTISGGTAIRSIRKRIQVNARNGCDTTSSSMLLRLGIRAMESWYPGMSTAQNELGRPEMIITELLRASRAYSGELARSAAVIGGCPQRVERTH